MVIVGTLLLRDLRLSCSCCSFPCDDQIRMTRASGSGWGYSSAMQSSSCWKAMQLNTPRIQETDEFQGHPRRNHNWFCTPGNPGIEHLSSMVPVVPADTKSRRYNPNEIFSRKSYYLVGQNNNFLYRISCILGMSEGWVQRFYGEPGGCNSLASEPSIDVA